MTQPRIELLFAIRWRHIVRHLGQFCLIIAALNMVTVGVGFLNGEQHIALYYLSIVVILGIAGAVCSRIRIDKHMQINEAMVLAAAVSLMVPLVAAIPLQLNGVAYLDAWFETVSAATTTGLSTQSGVTTMPATFVFARAWMQWYGGLGIVVLSLALVVRPGMNALRLAQMESPDDLVGGTRAHARRVLKVYLALTGLGMAGWLLLGGEPIEGVHYILAAVSTGGFAPTDQSFADLSGLRLAWLVTLVALAGAVPLSLYHRAIRNGWVTFFKNLELRALVAAGLVISGMLALCLWLQGMPLTEVLSHAPLMALSAQSTSGFSSLDIQTLDAGSKSILILAMVMGGSVGSTAGGVKLLRLLILFGLLYRCMQSMSMTPNAVISQRLGKRRIEANEVQDALMIILLFVGCTFLSWIPFLLYGYEPLDALFEVVSATGTVGLSAGITDAALPAPLKLVLGTDMLLGRLELVAWMVFFYHRTWFGRKRVIS